MTMIRNQRDDVASKKIAQLKKLEAYYMEQNNKLRSSGTLNNLSWFYFNHESYRPKYKEALALVEEALKQRKVGYIAGTYVNGLCKMVQPEKALPMALERIKRNKHSAWAYHEIAMDYATWEKRVRS